MPIEKQNQILMEKVNKQLSEISQYKNICIDIKNSLLSLQSTYPDKESLFQCDINKLNTVLFE